MKIINLFFKYELIILLFLPNFVFGQKQQTYKLLDLQNQGKLIPVNREVLVFDNFLKLTEKEGEGLVWLPIYDFINGEIEIEMRGKDVLQKSFIGVAFHAQNDSTYDAIYCRPFNFFAKDSVRKIHAIQYISHPKYTWKKLRDERNGIFEKGIENPPNPNEWFTMRVVVQGKNIKAFINQDETPSLVIKKLGIYKNGKLGIFVGSGAGGDFRSIKIKSK